MNIFKRWTIETTHDIFPGGNPLPAMDITKPFEIAAIDGQPGFAAVRFTGTRHQDAGVMISANFVVRNNRINGTISSPNVANAHYVVAAELIVDDNNKSMLIGFLSLDRGSQDSGGTWTGK